MPKYYGCPCESCGKPLMLKDDIVVCPDCGAPYHRTCYEALGQCAHTAAHKAGYEWEFPYKDAELRTCTSCGERTLRSDPVCRCCGAQMPDNANASEQPNDRAAAENEKEGRFNYENLYSSYDPRSEESLNNSMRKTFRAVFGNDEMMDGIPLDDWIAYIGPAFHSYLASYVQMQVSHKKFSMSFSALFFGPFYFFYRKAWKPAFAFLGAELLLGVPTFISMMQVTGSSFAPNLSENTLFLLARIATVLSFVLMVVRTLYAKWLYRKSSAEQIRRIRADFPDADKRQAVLAAQGGVSWAAVFGSLVLLAVVGGFLSLLMGPNISALLATV